MKNNVYVVSCDWFSISCVSDLAQEMVFSDKPATATPQAKTMPFPKSAPTTTDEVCSLANWYDEPIRVEVPRALDKMTWEYGAERFKGAVSLEYNPAYGDKFAVEWRGAPFAHIFYRPRNPHVNPRATLVKVANCQLYQSQWSNVLQMMLRALGIRFVRIARVDVCADFEYFANGRLPLKFAQDYLSKPTASRPSFIRKSSNKFVARGVKAFDKLLFETIQWGTRDSAVQVNLYNKTRELQSVHDKPWIRAKWRDYGLPDDISKQARRFVWRVEFSLNPSLKYVQDRSLSRLREIMLSDVDSQRALDGIFTTLVADYFQFYYLAPSDVKGKRRVKDLRPVVLFSNLDAAPYKLRTFVAAHGSCRTERMLLRKVDDILSFYKDLSPDEFDALTKARDVLAGVFHVSELESEGRTTGNDILTAFFKTLVPKAQWWQSREQHSREVLRYVDMLKNSGATQAFNQHYREIDALLDEMRDEVARLLEGAPEYLFDYTPEDVTEEEWQSLISMPIPDSALNTPP